MEKNNALNYDNIILNELEHKNWTCLALKELSDQFLKNSVFEFEVEQISQVLSEILSSKNNVRPLILLIIANRFINIANKIIFLKGGKHLEENLFLPEFELLVNILKQGNIIKECCEYSNDSDSKNTNNAFTIEVLNALIKIPTLAINTVLTLKPSLKNNMDVKILDKYIPMELHDSNYYKNIWIRVLCILDDLKLSDKTTCTFLQVIFNRLFTRGYKDVLCKLMIDWMAYSNQSLFECSKILNNGKLCLVQVFYNILEINKTDKNLIKSFIKQLFKEIEKSRLRIHQGIVFLNLNNTSFEEGLKLEDIRNDDFFLFNKSIVDYCITEEELNKGKSFLKDEVFIIKRQNFSVQTYLIFLDICVLNIIKSEDLSKYVQPEQNFDYLEWIKSEKQLIEIEESNKSKLYLSFLRDLILCLVKQWNSYQELMTYSLTLSTVIIRSISILVYLYLSNLSNLKGMLLGFYMDITEGIQFRLKNIDPIIRSSAMHLGEFYFNLLYELFPSTNEANSGYLISEIPKFDELKLLTPEIKNRMACIYNSTKFFIIKSFPSESEVQIFNSTEPIKDIDLNQIEEKEYTENQDKKIVDEDDEFWDKAPSIKINTKSRRRIIEANNSKSLHSITNSTQKKQGSKRKLVNKSLDMINLYTDEKKSKEIQDKDEKLLSILKELAEDIENDDSNYDHLILPLIDKLISLKEKDQKLLAILILSKLIQCKSDKVAPIMIEYSCNMNNWTPMDIRILILNSLTSACENMANSQIDNQSIIHPNKKSFVNKFDKHSLIWSSHLAKYVMTLILQSEDHENSEKIPNLFFISTLELFNKVILNTSPNNTSLEQITYSGLELVISIDFINNHLFKDIAVRKSIYMLTFNIIIKCKSSSYCMTLNQILPQLLTWLSKAENSETDLNSIQIIQEILTHIS